MPATIEFSAAVANFPTLKGDPGSGTSMRISGGPIQIKRDDASAWTNLLSVASIIRAEGAEVALSEAIGAEASRAKAAEVATDLCTAEVQLRSAGTVPPWALGDRLDGILRSLLRVTVQGDIVPHRLRPARMPRRFGRGLAGILCPRLERLLEVTSRGEVRVSALRVSRLLRAVGGAMNGILGPRGERALVVTDRLDTRLLRLRLAPLALAVGAALSGISGARGERLQEVTSRGEIRVPALQLPANRDRTNTFAARIMSGNGRPFLDFLPSGRTRFDLDPASFIAARLAARRDPEDVMALGAVGQIEDVHVLPGPGRRMSYRTNADGVFALYVLRRDLPVQGPHLLMPGRTVEGQISYGQSWRAEAFQVDALTAAYEPRRAMLLAGINNGALTQIPTIGTSDGINGVRTFWGLKPGSFIGIGAAAMMTQQRLRTTGLVYARTLVDTNASFPGARWDQLKPGTEPWTVGIAQRAKAAEIAALYGATVNWRSIGFTHEAAPNGRLDGNGNVIDYYAVLTDMVAAHDALNLNGIGGESLKYFIDQTAPVSEATVAQDAILTQMQFALDRSDRVFNIGPRYPYPFRDNIHHTALGYLQVGELEGYAKFVVLDLGLPWTPARPTSFSITGNTVTIQVAQPYGMGGLAIDTISIEAAPQRGFKVRAGGSDIAVTNVAVSGSTITLTLASPITAGTAVEVSYAFYGPGSPAGTHSGVWGNVKRPGPASPLLPGRTIDAWLTVFRQSVTAS